MATKTYSINTLDDLKTVAKQVLEDYKEERIFAFYGEMGAGKTTFIKELCKNLGVIDQVSSPTFSIINEYSRADGGSVYHADFYRIKNEEEAYNAGFDEYLHSGNYCFIEWAEKIENLLSQNSVKMVFSVNKDQRIINIEK